MSPVDRLRLETELQNKMTYSPEEAKRNIAETLVGLAYSSPLAPAMSARDAIESKEEAARLRAQGFTQNAERQDRLTAASAASAFLPGSGGLASNVEGAASRAGVFVPAGERAVLRERDRLARILAGERISTGSGRLPAAERGFTSPEGIVKTEISDQPMTMRPERFAPGDKVPLGAIVEHPELFDRMPAIRDTPVQFSPPTGRSDPVARTFADTMEFAPRSYSSQGYSEWMRRNIAKLMQYQIGKESDFALATKHGTQATIDVIDQTIPRVQAAMDARELNLTGNKYINYLTGIRRRIIEKLKTGQSDPYAVEGLSDRFFSQGMTPTRKDVERAISEEVARRTAGNLEAQVVRQRFSNPEDNTSPGAFNYGGLIVLPQSNGDIARFVMDWAKYGQGSGVFGKPKPLTP